MSVRNPATSGSSAVSGVTLVQQAQAGCEDSLDVLIARHGLVQAVVRRQVWGDLPFVEALHAGRIGLWQAILGFDPSPAAHHLRSLWLERSYPALLSSDRWCPGAMRRAGTPTPH